MQELTKVHQARKKIGFSLKETYSPEGRSEGHLKFHNLKPEPALTVVEKPKPKKDYFTLVEEEKKAEIRKKKYKSKNYFGVKNHIDLFEIGRHYSRLQEENSHSFAFYSGKNLKLAHHSMLGLASYFNYHKDLKVTIFVEDFHSAEIKQFLAPTHIEVEAVEGAEEEIIESYSCDGIEIIELSKLRHLAHKIGENVFHNFLQSFVKRAEMVFWELPEVSQIDKEREFYLPIISTIHSMSLVAQAGKTRQSEIRAVHAFSNKYQIKIDGAIFYNKRDK